jgi:ParB/RepB/Spo0J family partition protein
MPTDLLIPLEQLQEPSDAMRYDMDDVKMEELLDDVRRNGILSRLWVIQIPSPTSETGGEGVDGVAVLGPTAPSQYQVRAGHRRLLVCRHLSLSPVPCTLFTPEDAAYPGLMSIENLIREDLSDFEEGCHFARIAEEVGITEEQLKKRCAKSLPYIYERIKLVQGDPDVAVAVHRRQISLGVAKKLNQIRYPAPGQVGEKLVGEALQNAIASADAYRAMFLERAVTGGCTIAVAESWVAQWRQSAGLVVTSSQPAVEPMPAAGYPLPRVTCAICGESDEPHNFETVSIHRNELAAIRAGMAAQAGSN